MLRRIWAIADTHLSFAKPKPMSVFGSHWLNHTERIKKNCDQLIGSDDLLLIPGDISWALKRKDAELDLEFISHLPGTKVVCKGNHDYWWSSDKRLNYSGIHDTPFILGHDEVGIAGTRGWIPVTGLMTADERSYNQNIITREVNRMAKKLKAIEHCPIRMVIVHYPPLDDFRQLFTDYGVSTVLYGHLHLDGSDRPLPEDWFGIKCICVAADRVNFIPKLVRTIDSANKPLKPTS
jgi:predicted phosphohydrolase